MFLTIKSQESREQREGRGMLGFQEPWQNLGTEIWQTPEE